MKITVHSSVENQVSAEFEKRCKEEDITPSQGIEYLLILANNHKVEIKPVDVTCEKCGANYSSKLSQCPGCKSDETAKLENEIEEKNKRRIKMTSELNKAMEEHRQSIQDFQDKKITKEDLANSAEKVEKIKEEMVQL